MYSEYSRYPIKTKVVAPIERHSLMPTFTLYPFLDHCFRMSYRTLFLRYLFQLSAQDYRAIEKIANGSVLFCTLIFSSVWITYVIVSRRYALRHKHNTVFPSM